MFCGYIQKKINCLRMRATKSTCLALGSCSMVGILPGLVDLLRKQTQGFVMSISFVRWFLIAWNCYGLMTLRIRPFLMRCASWRPFSWPQFLWLCVNRNMRIPMRCFWVECHTGRQRSFCVKFVSFIGFMRHSMCVVYVFYVMNVYVVHFFSDLWIYDADSKIVIDIALKM